MLVCEVQGKGGWYPGSNWLSYCWVKWGGPWIANNTPWTRGQRTFWHHVGETLADYQCSGERPLDGSHAFYLSWLFHSKVPAT
jgi:hypothetical protein